VVVIRARSTFAVESLGNRRKTTVEKHQGRTYYRASAANTLGERFYCWAPNDHTLIVALQPGTLDSIPTAGQAPAERLAPRLLELAETLLPAGATCWAVLDSDSWDTLAGLAFLASKKNESLQAFVESLTYLKTAVVGVRVEDDEPIFTAWVDLKSEKSAEDLRQYLSKLYTRDGGAITVGGAGARVMVRVPASAGGLATAIQRAIPVKKSTTP
jgi:hypothetical protein